MNLVKHLIAAAALSLTMTACASNTGKPDIVAEEPALISQLPRSIESFDYEGYRSFQDDSAGFTFRYTNEHKHRMADVYVYPVAEQNKSLNHNQLVLGSTRATLAAIGDAVKDGLYSNFNVVGAATQARGMHTVARVEATYLRHNLASYTLVYQSEYSGTLMKIRVTMPDNESNRSNAEWDRFAEQMFSHIVNNLDTSQPPMGAALGSGRV